MDYHNSSSGAKWLFWLAIVVMGAAFILGILTGNAKWLNDGIAAAEAKQMNQNTETRQQDQELDYLQRKAEIERKNRQVDQQAKTDAAKQEQDLEAQKTADIQFAAFREKIYDTVNFGLSFLMIAASIVVVISGVYGAFGARQWMAAKAKEIQFSEPPAANRQQPRRQPSREAIRARERERRKREAKIAMKSTIRAWPENGADQELISGQYPWAN